MIGGIERYYQITKCFRDEDLVQTSARVTQVDGDGYPVGRCLHELGGYKVRAMHCKQGIDSPVLHCARSVLWTMGYHGSMLG